MDQEGIGEVSTLSSSLPLTRGTVRGAEKSPMGCEMPPESSTACGEAAAAACSRALGPARVLCQGDPSGGLGARCQGNPLIAVSPSHASSASGTQGRKLYHDGKIKKIQLLVYGFTKKPFLRPQIQRCSSQKRSSMKPALI